MNELKNIVCKKFKILILIDLGGTLFLRTSEEVKNGTKWSYKFKLYFYYFRPGYDQLLLRILNHPRSRVAFYTSIMRKNTTGVFHRLLKNEQFDSLKSGVGVFDQEYCSKMSDNEYYKELM